MDTSKSSMRILMFPWLAHGHISPFLELAKSLSKRNFITYICSSSVNLQPIRKSLSPKYSVSVKLVDLHIPATADLPPHRHTTNGLPPHLMAPLKRALDSARPSFSDLIKTLTPDLVVYDFIQPWAPEEAAAHSIPAVLFLSTGGAAMSRITYHWLDHGSEDTYPFPEIYFRENEYNIFCRMVGSDTEDHFRVDNCVKRSDDIVLIKTFRDLEGKYIDFVSDQYRKKFVPVGPLVQELGHETENQQDQNGDRKIMEWLDKKDVRSTIFASFGTEYFLSKNEIEEIAYGLDLSGLNFILVLRFPDSGETKVELPEGFRERGIVVEWAPQRRILCHRSVGGFMSHCGWSSVMEGAFSGVPIVAVPMHLDQPLNARVVVEAGIGEEIVRRRDGGLERDEVVRKVVVEESGEEVRRRVAAMGRKMRAKGGEEEIDGVVRELARLCGKGESEDLMKGLNLEVMENRERVLSENT